VLESIELSGCKNLSEYLINKIVSEYKNVKFVDLSHIPVMNPAFYEQLKNERPDLMMRRFKTTEVDPKDNMLRVPLRTVEKGGKKKGKKGKKKKK